MDNRTAWITRLATLVGPVLRAAAAGRLHADMPIEARPGQAADRATVTHLEALGRTFAGIAPWLEQDAPAPETAHMAEALARVADPSDPDRCNWATGQQPIVDAAFLAQGLLRAPRFTAALPARTRGLLLNGFLSLRDRAPYFSNWLLFAAMSETAILRLGGVPDPMRVDYALRQHEAWYLGDGMYGDGVRFHWDYYNAYVIQPMLVDVATAFADRMEFARDLLPHAKLRLARHAAVQERLIAADGSFPPIGRSLAYRCGAFQALAQAARQGLLGEAQLAPGQARRALGLVIARTLDAPGTYDAAGWLRAGLAGHQPDLMEGYISTGSLYLAATAFLPLGLSATDPFWSDPAAPTTQERAWSGVDLPADHAMRPDPRLL
jgi:hypothetical protein